jgi:hypothetical protein
MKKKWKYKEPRKFESSYFLRPRLRIEISCDIGNSKQKFMKFKIPVKVSIKILVFWDVASCRSVDRYERFDGAFCLHL